MDYLYSAFINGKNVDDLKTLINQSFYRYRRNIAHLYLLYWIFLIDRFTLTNYVQDVYKKEDGKLRSCGKKTYNKMYIFFLTKQIVLGCMMQNYHI